MCMWQVWLIIAGIFFVGEIITVGFLIFWLAIGALIAMISSFFVDSIIIQTAIFVISSALLILFTKPFVEKYVSKTEDVKTNAFSLIDKEGIVTVDLNPDEGSGQVKVNGEIWSAISEDNTIIKKGTKVQVDKIEGVKLIVKPCKEYSNV